MATIFQKLPASGDSCLILDPREALVYPFNINGWSELRVGGFFSYTTSTDSNALFPDEVLSHSTLANNWLAFGIKDRNDFSLTNPLCSGFFGFLTRNDNNANTALYNGDVEEVLSTFMTGGLIKNQGKFQNFNRLQIPPGANSTGSTFYASTWLMKVIRYSGNYYSGYCGVGNYYDNNDYSTTSLRSIMGNESNYSNTTALQGGFTVSGADLNTLYVYSPFFNNRLRIHGLAVEKYS